MRIDGNHGLDPRSIRDNNAAAPGSPPSSQPGKPAPEPSDAKAAEFVKSCSAYIQAALAGEEIDSAAIEQARKLLESGELDSAAAIRRAAETILERGI